MPKKFPRKTIKKEDLTNVLIKSRRRCALCFGLEGDAQIKKGQIAHIDQNPSNNDFNNLAYLCLDHHDAFDSKTSQSKNITAEEIQEYQLQLQEAFKERHYSLFSNIAPIGKFKKEDSNFELYRQSNPKGEFGYKVIAANLSKSIAVALEEGHITLEYFHEDFQRWLRNDYEPIGKTFIYNAISTVNYIEHNFLADFYNLIAYFPSKNTEPEISISCYFGEDHFLHINLSDEDNERYATIRRQIALLIEAIEYSLAPSLIPWSKRTRKEYLKDIEAFFA